MLNTREDQLVMFVENLKAGSIKVGQGTFRMLWDDQGNCLVREGDMVTWIDAEDKSFEGKVLKLYSNLVFVEIAGGEVVCLGF